MRILIGGFVGAAAIAFMATSVSAADLPVKAPRQVATPGFNWTGCFGGGHVGGLWGHKDWTLQPPDPVTPLGSHNADSWVAGVQVGCDYQFANGFVVGVQGDYGWSDASGSFVDVVDGVTDRSHIIGLASVTGRLGYAWDRWLGYVKGGGAWARDHYDRVIIGGIAVAGLAQETRAGWTAGVGVEYAFSNNWSAFVEYDHYGFGRRTLTFLDPVGAFNDNIRIGERADVVKAGVNFRWAGR